MISFVIIARNQSLVNSNLSNYENKRKSLVESIQAGRGARGAGRKQRVAATFGRRRRHYDSPLITSLTAHIKTKQTAAAAGAARAREREAPSFLESVSLIYVMRRYALSPNI